MKKIFNKKTEKKITKIKQGFSLIEVLFSLLVLSIGIGAVMSLMTINITTSNTAKNQIIASELAQEGLELIKNLKDNAATPTTFTSQVSNGNDYRVDYFSLLNTFSGSGPADSKRLNLDATAKIYSHSSLSTPTKFFRKIAVVVDTVDSKKVATVTSYVTWNGTGFGAITPFPAACTVANKCVTVVSVLPNLL